MGRGGIDVRRGRDGKGSSEHRINYERRKGSGNNDGRRLPGSQQRESNIKESIAKGKTTDKERGRERRSAEKEAKAMERDGDQQLQENGTEGNAAGGEEKETPTKKRETRRKSPAVTSIGDEAKPWGKSQKSSSSSNLIPSNSLQSLPTPSRGGASLTTPYSGSFTLPRRANKSGSEPPVIRPLHSHRTPPSRPSSQMSSKRTLSSTLSAPQPRTSSFCPSCPPRTYSSLPRTFTTLPRRSNKASYTFYSHSISTTISASPNASSTNLFIPRKVPFSYPSIPCSENIFRCQPPSPASPPLLHDHCCAQRRAR